MMPVEIWKKHMPLHTQNPVCKMIFCRDRLLFLMISAQKWRCNTLQLNSQTLLPDQADARFAGL